MLADVGQALRDHVVRRDLHGLRQASVELDRQGDRHGGTGCDGLKCNSETMPGQHRRMEAVRHVPQLGEGGADLLARVVQPSHRRGVRAQPAFQKCELERQRDESLLRPVVQVALQPLALGLSRLDDAGARTLQLLQVRLQLGVQLAVLQCDAGRCADRRQQVRLVVQRGVVQQGRDMPAVPVDRRRGASARRRQSHQPALHVRPAVELGQPVDELERGIAQDPGQRVAQVARSGVGPQVHEQVGHCGAGQARVEES